MNKILYKPTPIAKSESRYNFPCTMGNVVRGRKMTWCRGNRKGRLSTIDGSCRNEGQLCLLTSHSYCLCSSVSYPCSSISYSLKTDFAYLLNSLTTPPSKTRPKLQRYFTAYRLFFTLLLSSFYTPPYLLFLHPSNFPYTPIIQHDNNIQ